MKEDAIQKMVGEEVKKMTGEISEQIKEGMEGVNGVVKSFEEFKEAYDTQLKELKEGRKDPLLDDKIAKIEKDMDDKLIEIQQMQSSKEVAGDDARFKIYKDQGNLTVEEKDYLDKFKGFIQEGSRLNKEELPQFIQDYKAKTGLTISEQDGGFAVPPQIDRMVRKIQYDTSPIRMDADTQVISSSSLEILTESGKDVSAEWISEQAPRTDSDNKQLELIVIPTHELDAQPKASSKLIEDAFFDIEAWYSRITADRFARKENLAFIKGTGIQQPVGFTNFARRADGVKDDHRSIELTGVDGVLTPDILIDLQTGLKTVYDMNAKWFMNRFSLGQLRKLKDSEGRYYLSFDRGLQDNARVPMLLAKPIRIYEDLDTYGNTAGLKPVYYGDMKKAYCIVDRLGISVIRDNITEKGFVKFYTKKRAGGGVVEGDALKGLIIE